MLLIRRFIHLVKCIQGCSEVERWYYRGVQEHPPHWRRLTHDSKCEDCQGGEYHEHESCHNCSSQVDYTEYPNCTNTECNNHIDQHSTDHKLITKCFK